jgi:hypothetical protein
MAITYEYVVLRIVCASFSPDTIAPGPTLQLYYELVTLGIRHYMPDFPATSVVNVVLYAFCPLCADLWALPARANQPPATSAPSQKIKLRM